MTGDFATRRDELERRIRTAGGDDRRIAIVAVSKGFAAPVVATATSAGQWDFGENRMQELAAKAESVGDDRVRWHFVGRIQRNKIRKVAHLVELWHSVDRVEVGDEIAKRAPGARVLVQVDAAGEPQKGGCPVDQADALIAGLRARDLQLDGVMAMGVAADTEATAAAFAEAVDVADRHGLGVRSLGMSDDLEIAVRAGTTMVRVGTALFGPRPSPDQVEH